MQQLAKKEDFKIFKNIDEASSFVSIHQIINLNSNLKFNYYNDVELLKHIRKRKLIRDYLNFDFEKLAQNSKRDRRYFNFLKWKKILNSKFLG